MNYSSSRFLWIVISLSFSATTVSVDQNAEQFQTSWQFYYSNQKNQVSEFEWQNIKHADRQKTANWNLSRKIILKEISICWSWAEQMTENSIT